MLHLPSQTLAGQHLRRLAGSVRGIACLALLTLAFGYPMQYHASFLITAQAPSGILSLQLTFGADAARDILSSWDTDAKQHAHLSLWWDMGFAVSYGFLLAMLTERIGKGLGRFTPIAAWMPIWAGVADLVENLFHLVLLSNDFDAPTDPTGLFTGTGFAFASVKWTLLACWLVLLLFALIVSAVRCVHRKSL